MEKQREKEKEKEKKTKIDDKGMSGEDAVGEDRKVRGTERGNHHCRRKKGKEREGEHDHAANEGAHIPGWPLQLIRNCSSALLPRVARYLQDVHSQWHRHLLHLSKHISYESESNQMRDSKEEKSLKKEMDMRETTTMIRKKQEEGLWDLEDYRITILATYAMSECFPICSNPVEVTADQHQRHSQGSVGPAAGPEIAIRDLVSGVVHTLSGPSHQGEVVVRGAMMFRGYIYPPSSFSSSPTSSSSPFSHSGSAGIQQPFVDGGWLCTGDIGD
tara:strand:+ start:548 stop:1366 length:819 start_codon:yes stop_codon:yes gene_type:complete